MSENIEKLAEALEVSPEAVAEQIPPNVEEKPKATRGRKPAEPKVEEFVPAVRRIVLYVTGQETVRPAIITRDNGDQSFQLTVFNSSEAGAVHVERSQYMPYDDELGFVPGTFH